MEQYLRQQIEKYRSENNMTQKQFSELIGVKYHNFVHYMYRDSNWSISFISSLFKVLNIKMVISELDQETAQEIVNINERMLNVINKDK